MKITLVRSLIGTPQDHRDTVRALGLRKKNQSREVVDTDDVRGMVRKVAYLLEISEDKK